MGRRLLVDEDCLDKGRSEDLVYHLHYHVPTFSSYFYYFVSSGGSGSVAANGGGGGASDGDVSSTMIPPSTSFMFSIDIIVRYMLRLTMASTYTGLSAW